MMTSTLGTCTSLLLKGAEASYYEGLSAGIDSDAYFEEVLRKVWDLPNGFFQHLQHLEVDKRSGLPQRSVIPHHQHHNPTYFDHLQGEKRRGGQGRTGHRLLRTLRRCLAQCCRGNATMLPHALKLLRPVLRLTTYIIKYNYIINRLLLQPDPLLSQSGSFALRLLLIKAMAWRYDETGSSEGSIAEPALHEDCVSACFRSV